MKELEDYQWFPNILRQFQMDFIGFIVTKFNFYDVFIHHLKKEITMPLPMYDLCSGSGEPAISIFQKNNLFSELILSDKFPSSKEIVSSDVLLMEFEQGKCYTMFNAFHHFSDIQKKEIVVRMQQAGSKGYIVEILEPTFLFIIKVCMLTIVANLFITPFIRPFSFLRLFFTYVIPVNIITIAYDGVISVFKSRTVKQYKQILPIGVNIYHLKKRLSSLVVIEIN